MNDVIEFIKHKNDKINKYFKFSEFDCHCKRDDCAKTKISLKLITKLKDIRESINKPILIKSAYRCKMHQNELKNLGFKTAVGVSQHELGRACDIEILSNKVLMSGEDIKRILLMFNIKAIGVASNWAHFDLRDDKERFWKY